MRGLIVDYVGVLDGTEEDNRRWKALLAAAKANGAASSAFQRRLSSSAVEDADIVNDQTTHVFKSFGYDFLFNSPRV